MGVPAARLLVMVFLVSAAGLLYAPPAQSAEHSARVFRQQVRGLTTVAVAESRLDACRFRSVVIAGQTAGQRRTVSYEELVHDVCTDSEHQAGGTAEATVFKIDAVGQLRRAHVVADVPLDNGRAVHVDETFKGFGSISRDTRINVIHEDGFHFLSTRLERFRRATATGTVTASYAYMLYAREGLLNVCVRHATADNCFF